MRERAGSCPTAKSMSAEARIYMASKNAETTRGQRGLTIIELLVVVGILTMLFVALLPMIGGSEDSEKRTRTKSILAFAVTAAKTYMSQRRFGDFPPDDYRDTAGKLEVSSGNGTNIGIESFVFYLNRQSSTDPSFPSDEAWLGNTDGDSSKKMIDKLQTKERLELCDAWGNPIAYFHKRNYTREQNYRLDEQDGELDEAEQPVSAWKDGARYINPTSFQLFSAGPDGVYGTKDDIGGNFTVPKDD